MSGLGISPVLDVLTDGFADPRWEIRTDNARNFLLVTPPGGTELLFACRADTVPFDADEWRHHPLSGELKDGRVHGRVP